MTPTEKRLEEIREWQERETQRGWIEPYSLSARVAREHIPWAIAHIKALEEKARRAEEALRFQDPRNATERYDRIADDFYRLTGRWPPGRSRPAAMGADPDGDATGRAWRDFCNDWHERWFDDALAALKRDTEGAL